MKIQSIKKNLKSLNLSGAEESLEEIIAEAESKECGYLEYTQILLTKEFEKRERNRIERNTKLSKLPVGINLDNYDFKYINGLNPSQINQLRELNWLSQNYNLIFLGPPGVGKTFIAAGLGGDAIKAGYKVIFRTMEEINKILKFKDITRSFGAEYKRLINSDLLIIDDMMMFPMEKQESVNLFHLINNLHEKSSIILTSNKDPQGWSEMMEDEVLTTAILDRLMYRCQPIHLSGNSFRLENRQTIFEKKNVQS